MQRTEEILRNEHLSVQTPSPDGFQGAYDVTSSVGVYEKVGKRVTVEGYEQYEQPVTDATTTVVEMDQQLPPRPPKETWNVDKYDVNESRM